MNEQQTADVIDYYTTRYREDLRLAGRPSARLERIRTTELLHQLLPAPGARVLDVGGGPGVYARLLTAAGHQVRLLDLVPAHVELARTGQPPVPAAVADARALPEPDDGYDATLLLGPLYHLTERADRVAALTEAVRVTRPGGHVAAAVISRFAGPMDFTATGRMQGVWFDETVALHTSGVNNASIGFTVAYFHRLEELLDECRAAGLRDVVVHGLEGPAWTAAEAAVGTDREQSTFDGALHLARVLSSEPGMVAASGHLLAVGRVSA